MAKSLTPISSVSPGAKGLNTRFATRDIGLGWSTKAINAIVDDSGNLASRKGWTKVNASSVTGQVKAIKEYVDSSGISRIVWAAGTKIYEGSGATDITGTLTPTDSNWRFVNFNNKIIGVQAGHNPIVKTGSGNFAEITFDGTINQPYEALVAAGRVWYVDANGTTVKYSDLLIESALNDGTSPGSSGVIDVKTVWGDDGDRVTALAELNGRLVIFGQTHTIIYKGIEDPNTNLALEEVIRGTGCIARDGVITVNGELWFISKYGLLSLSRTEDAGSLPLRILSQFVETRFSDDTSGESADNIKMGHNPVDGIVVISLTGKGKAYCVSSKVPSDDKGTPVFTEWTGNVPYSMDYARDTTFYLGQNGYIGKYDGYSDNGSSYTFEWWSGWTSGVKELEGFQGGATFATRLKVLKHAKAVLGVFGNQPVTLGWEVDFGSSAGASTQSVVSGQSIAEYNVSEYNIAEYSGGTSSSESKFNMSRKGRLFRIYMQTSVSGGKFSLYRVDIYTKTGGLAV